MPLHEDVMRALDEVVDPCSLAAGTTMSLTELGLIRTVTVSPGGDVRIVFGVTGPGCMFLGTLAQGILSRVGGVAGVTSVDVALDTDFTWTPAAIAPAAQTRLDSARGTAERELSPVPAPAPRV